ncbi:endolytic transglycosylase MltG [Nocardia sp. 348MFTsu5.1]|uniref:endolytic transglycosylase MltG n=1 Tax=Nocardia sp. 348MFTsu5.1 TaxID=1172185 RepID=UPI0003665071|nr:endolytic transglycosylase MltG [Nocardia sp. 348MFTsu5.1]
MSDDRSDDRRADVGPGRRRRRADTPYDADRLRYFTQGDGTSPGRRRGPEVIPPRDPAAGHRSPQPPPPAAEPLWEPQPDTSQAVAPPLPTSSRPPSRQIAPEQNPPHQAPARTAPEPIHPRAYDPDPRHDARAPYVDPGRAEYTRRHEAVGGRPSGGRSPKRSAAAAARRRKRKLIVVSAALIFMLALVGGIGYAGLRIVGFFGSDDEDYTNVAGTSDVLVSIPQDATLTTVGQILDENDVVASVGAFTTEAGNQPISPGFYKLRTQIPAETAVAMLTDMENRVGRVVIPEGLQLDSKVGIDGKTTPGIFARVAEATTVDLNGVKQGSTVEDLAQAAATATPEELGVPAWALDPVSALAGDHRRIEGLIAPTSWEMIDPGLTPVQTLNYLISRSASLFAQWGLPESGTTSTGLTPYQTLVAASIVEREVNTAADYPKVARVIVNRLADDQALQMDSTVNYTSAVQNIDVAGDDFTAATKWNTYQQKGLPITPIGAVGQEALQATLDPPAGNWLYFVTVDREGTTLFTEDYEQHKRNRQQACDNAILQTNC